VEIKNEIDFLIKKKKNNKIQYKIIPKVEFLFETRSRPTGQINKSECELSNNVRAATIILLYDPQMI
jgi:hypothetical protein